jgi:hypothetical protein
MPIDELDTSAYEKLNQATQCLDKERDFLNALFKTEVAGRVANRIIVMTSVFDAMESSIPKYLQAHSSRLFNYKPDEVGNVLSMIVSEIAREVRLCAYLSTKGVFPQALSGLRRGIELIGIYAHIWNDPTKIDYLNDPDSKDYRKAFTNPSNDSLIKSLKDQNIKYRFQLCWDPVNISKMYALFSEHFTHATSFNSLVLNSFPPDPALSCSFIRRQAPEEYNEHYKLTQQLLGLLLVEIKHPIPEDDLLSDELQAFTLFFTLVTPLLVSSEETMPSELKSKIDLLLNVIREMQSD